MKSNEVDKFKDSYELLSIDILDIIDLCLDVEELFS